MWLLAVERVLFRKWLKKIVDGIGCRIWNLFISRSFGTVVSIAPILTVLLQGFELERIGSRLVLIWSVFTKGRRVAVEDILVVICCCFISFSFKVNILENLYFSAFANFKSRRKHLGLFQLTTLFLFWLKRFNLQALLRLVLLSNGFHLFITCV